jgi:hypothetical protein
MRVNAEHRDGAANRLPRHSQQEQALNGSGGALLHVGCGAISKEEVEAVMEVDSKFAVLVGLEVGDARPAVYLADVVQERASRAKKAACLTRAVPWRVRARRAVAVSIIVGRPRGAAMGGVRAWDADGLHQSLHGMAQAVAAGGDATHMVALARGLELVAARRAHDVAHFTLRAFVISIDQSMSSMSEASNNVIYMRMVRYN